MDDGGVKSALELAMERMSNLPDLTPEEIAEQKEKEYRPIGEALGNRYLQNIINGQELLSGLNRYAGEQGAIVRKFLVQTLCDSLQLGNFADAERALKGLYELAPGDSEFMDDARSVWDRIRTRFEKGVEETERKFQVTAMKTFAGLGISGSAIRANTKGSETFQQAVEELRSYFSTELQRVRSTLEEKFKGN